MRTSRLAFITLLIISLMTLGGCKDNDTTDPPSASDVDNTNLLTERVFNDAGALILNAFSDEGGTLKSGKTVKNSETGCATVTFDLTAQPHTMTIDFGNTNCPGSDLVNRRGKIVSSFTGLFSDSLNTITTTFDHFFVNDNQVTGTRIMTYKGRNLAGRRNWDVQVTNGSVILANNEGTVTYEANRHYERTEGEGTLAYTDDVYAITGSSSGSTLGGRAFSTLITTPVISKMNCSYFVSGKVDITPVSAAIRTINYGDGECDNKATLTVDGVVIDIVLPY